MINTTKKQDQMHLPSRSNSLFLIPKAGNRVLIRSDPTTKQLYPIRSEMILLDPKSEKIRSDRIRIGFGSDLAICTSLVPTFLRRTHTHLKQGTRSSKKATNINDVKRYRNVASIAKDGLLAVPRTDSLSPITELIIFLRRALDGLIKALYVRLDHPTTHQLNLAT